MAKQEEGFQKGKVLTISAAHFVHDCYTSFLAPALPLIIEKLGISYGMTGLLAVIQRIPSLFNPFIGIIAERPVMRYMVVFSPALTALFMSLIGIAPGYTFLAVLLFFSGISSTLWHIPTPVIVRALSGSRPGKGMSYYMVGGELARTAGPLIILGVISLVGTGRNMENDALGFCRLHHSLPEFQESQNQTHHFLQATPGGQLLENIPSLFGSLPSDRWLYLFSGRNESITDLLPAHLPHLPGTYPSFFRSGPYCDPAGRCCRGIVCRDPQR